MVWVSKNTRCYAYLFGKAKKNKKWQSHFVLSAPNTRCSLNPPFHVLHGTHLIRGSDIRSPADHNLSRFISSAYPAWCFRSLHGLVGPSRCRDKSKEVWGDSEAIHLSQNTSAEPAATCYWTLPLLSEKWASSCLVLPYGLCTYRWMSFSEPVCACICAYVIPHKYTRRRLWKAESFRDRK